MANQVMYGFQNLAEVFSRRVNDVGVPVVAEAIQQTVAEHNRQMNALMGLFVETTTDFKTVYRTPSAARLQPLDENGRARPISFGAKYEVGWPIQSAGTAFGSNYISQIKMTVEDANELTATMLSADFRWMRDHLLSAFLYDGNAGGGWTYTDEQHGALSVKSLADGDSTTYAVVTGAENGATDDHYLAQAGAIADNANPFPVIYNELAEHPENSGEVVVIVPTNLKASIEALATFYPESDPNLRQGVGVTELRGRLGVATPGELIGYVDRCWVYEWRSMVSDYMIAVTTGGPRPIRMRQHPESELQGFQRMMDDRNDHPFYERQWARWAGFGAWNRVGGVAYRIGNGSYATPTNYAPPMP